MEIIVLFCSIWLSRVSLSYSMVAETFIFLPLSWTLPFMPLCSSICLYNSVIASSRICSYRLTCYSYLVMVFRLYWLDLMARSDYFFCFSIYSWSLSYYNFMFSSELASSSITWVIYSTFSSGLSSFLSLAFSISNSFSTVSLLAL